MSNELGLPAKVVEAGLKAYDYFADRKKMPTNRRLFMESTLDGNVNDITEKDFSEEELAAIRKLVYSKYADQKDNVKKYRDHLAKRLEQHKQAVKAKDKDKILYPEFVKQYEQDFAATDAFLKGRITPQFVELFSENTKYPYERMVGMRGAQVLFPPLKSGIQYNQYPKQTEQGRTASSGANPFDAVATSLGRFNYVPDAQGNLTIQDTYDFNPRQNTILGTSVPSSVGEWEVDAGVFGGPQLYNALRAYAGEKLPPGKGRKVRINVPYVYEDPFKDSIGDTTR